MKSFIDKHLRSAIRIVVGDPKSGYSSGMGIFSTGAIHDTAYSLADKFNSEKITPVLNKSQKRLIRLWRVKSWGFALTFLTRGVKVTKPGSSRLTHQGRVRIPNGPLILVANHSSHMDSAVLASVVGAKRSFSFVAGAEYWSGSKFKSWVGRNLAGLFLVRKGADGWSDLLSSVEILHDGTILVIYPEGTRTRTGELGKFHTGAFRLAAHSGARILPVALIGCREALPAQGKFSRQKIVVRFGDPILVNEENISEASVAARDVIAKMLSEKDSLA